MAATSEQNADTLPEAGESAQEVAVRVGKRPQHLQRRILVLATPIGKDWRQQSPCPFCVNNGKPKLCPNVGRGERVGICPAYDPINAVREVFTYRDDFNPDEPAPMSAALSRLLDGIHKRAA